MLLELLCVGKCFCLIIGLISTLSNVALDAVIAEASAVSVSFARPLTSGVHFDSNLDRTIPVIHNNINHF